VDFSLLRSLFEVVSFVVVAAVAVVAVVAVTAVLWGGIAWLACGGGGGVLWCVWGVRGGGEKGGG
jgi:hypothetical protein